MTSIQTQKCYLEGIKIVVSHNLKEDLILNYGIFLKQLAKNINGQLVNSNIPIESPPELGRVAIGNKELNISFGLNRVEFNIVGSRKHGSSSSLENVYKLKINECFNILDAYFRLDDFQEEFIGILGPLKYPQDISVPKDELTLAVSEKYGANFKNKQIVTFSTKTGFYSSTREEFVNYEISNYEVKNIQITAVQPKTVIDLDKFPTVEHGVQFVIDVNNRPSMKKYKLKESIDNVVARFFEAVEQPELYL